MAALVKCVCEKVSFQMAFESRFISVVTSRVVVFGGSFLSFPSLPLPSPNPAMGSGERNELPAGSGAQLRPQTHFFDILRHTGNVSEWECNVFI